jgi:hypothetical protein
MSEINIRLLEREEYPLWDEIVQRSPQGTLFHTTPWLLLAERHSQTKLHLCIGTLGEEVIAGMPFFSEGRGIFRKVFSPVGSSMIHNLGPIYPGYEALKQYKREYYLRDFHAVLHQYIYSEYHPDIYSVTTSAPALDARPFLWAGYRVSPMYNFIADIRDTKKLWDGFKQELRKNIKKAENSGITIEEGGREEYFHIINSVIEKLKDEEGCPPKRALIDDLFQAFWPENFKIFVARYGGEIVGGIIALAFKDKVSAWYGAVKADLKGLYPTDLLHWHLVQWGCSNNYRYFEIYGANIPTISYYKSRYNFDLDLYFHVTRKSKLLQFYELLKS